MTLQLQLQFYSKLKNTSEDKEAFEAITGYKVERWTDKDPLQIIDIEKKEGWETTRMLNEIINHLSCSSHFRGWMSFPSFATKPLYYTPLLEVELESVEFCSMITPFEIYPHYTETSNPEKKIVVNFEHDIQRIMIYICGTTWHRIYIHYDELENHVVQQVTDQKTIRLVLSLKCCPSFWRSKKEVVTQKRKKLLRDHFTGERLEKKLRQKTPWTRVPTLTEDEGTNDIPKCSTIVLTYPASGSNISRIVSGFKKHQFQCYFTKFDDLRYPDNEMTGINDGSWIEAVMRTNPEHVDNINLRYSLWCLESLGYQFLDKLHKSSPEHKITFFRFLKQKIVENSLQRIDYVTQTIYKLALAFDKDPYLDPCSVFQLHFRNVDVRSCNLESHYQYIKRIIVTPSRTIFVPPEPIAINRILRTYINYVDNFARVCFRDEDFSQFNVHSKEATLNVRRVIDIGISISADIVFQFLGCSNSQLRSQGLWLFYPQCPITVENIRENIGDLNKMKTTQKYVTRMGLAFTATDFELSADVEIQEISEKELTVGNKRFIFSDGIGCISPAVRDLIIKEKYGDRVFYKPVAFQVRVGGCKGMVAVNPNLGQKLILQIRPSMKKFESDHKKIEPCGYAGARELYMNRQVIAILRAQGVPDNNFIALQNRSLLELADMLTKENLAAHEMGSKLRVKVSDLEKSLIRITTEPFLRRQLVSLYKFKVRDAIAKTRFRIDVNKGRQMKGIMDETNTLNYGEIFVQYTDLSHDLRSNSKIILKGEVFITKNPCLHPGDLKKVQAVDVSGLRHLYDVVVFPAKGQRPHPNELSGSDLDGDEYFVCWEESLMPKLDYEAAEYYIEKIEPSNDNSDEPHPEFTDEEINDFVFDYITKGSKLGQISNAHAIWADRLKQGVASKRCVGLASKHSDAVDFVKTGIAPTFDYAERSLIYPDWMMKPDKAAYNSKTAIGKMFHIVEGLEHAVLHLNIPENDIAPAEIFRLNQSPTTEELESATKHYDDYCHELANIMVAYGIVDEGDMAAGCLNTIKMSLAKEHERNYDMRDQCLSMYRSLQRKYSMIFFSSVGVTQYNWKHEEDKVLRQAAAWYWVTYHQPTPHQDLILLSFPWCVSNILIKIPELMNNKTTPNSVRSKLRAELKKWYAEKSSEGKTVKEKGREVLRWLSIPGVDSVTDISRYTYGLIPGNTLIYHVNKSPKIFAAKLKEKLETDHLIPLSDTVKQQLGEMTTDFTKSSENWAATDVQMGNGKILKVIITSDNLLHRKVNILKKYCQKYDILGHAMYIVLHWAERNHITMATGQDADLGISFLEFMLRKDDSQIFPFLEDEEVPTEVVIRQHPHANTATLYLEYLKWVIENCSMDGEVMLDDELLSAARSLLSTEKCLIALMREYHFISYSLTFESAESFKQISIMRKKDKKMCFNIARATSFCVSYFNNSENPENSAVFDPERKIEIKIRETELGGINALVLEIWGDNPQKMNNIADAFEINEDVFELYDSYLHVREDTKYRQLNFVAPKDIDKPLKLYFSLRKHMVKRDKAPLRHFIDPLYYDNSQKETSLKELVNSELLRKTRLMREGLYNKISHGDLSVTTTFGKLKIKRCDNGSLEKEYMSLIKDNKLSLLKKLKGITRTNYKEKLSYSFNVVYEGINYRIIFDKDQNLVSLSLMDITWTDMMILNNKGVDLNLIMTSTHTLRGESLNHLPLTYELYRGKKWIERVDKEKGIQLLGDTDEIPCIIVSIEVVTEKTHKFVKDPALKGMTVSELNVDVYKTLEKSFVKYSRSYSEIKLSAEIKTLNNMELIRKYQEVALSLAMVEKKTYGIWNSGSRRSSDWAETSPVPRLPRRPNNSGDSSAASINRSSVSPKLSRPNLGRGLPFTSDYTPSIYSAPSYASILPPSTSNSIGRLANECRMRSIANIGDHDDFNLLRPDDNTPRSLLLREDPQDEHPPNTYPISSSNDSRPTSLQNGHKAFNEPSYHNSYDKLPNGDYQILAESATLTELDQVNNSFLSSSSSESRHTPPEDNHQRQPHCPVKEACNLTPEEDYPASEASSGQDVEILESQTPEQIVAEQFLECPADSAGNPFADEEVDGEIAPQDNVGSSVYVNTQLPQ